MRRSRTCHRATKHAKRTSHARDRMHSIARHAAYVTNTMQRAAITGRRAQRERHAMRHALCTLPRATTTACTTEGWRCIAGGAATLHRSRPAAASGRCTAAARASRSGTASCCAARPSRSAPLSLIAHRNACLYGVRRVRVGCRALRQMCGAWCMLHQTLGGLPSAARDPSRPVAPRRLQGSRWPSAEHAPHECIRSSGW